MSETADHDFALTTWLNKTPDEIRFDIFVTADKSFRVVIPPGGKKQLPADYDHGIQTVRNGVVVGGLAPQLIKEGTARLPLHDALAAAAAAGDLEREIVRSTGFSVGSREVTALTAMQAEIEKLKKQLAASAPDAAALEAAKKAAQEADEARVREAEAKAAAKRAEDEARARESEVEALKRQLLELQTAPEAKGGKGGRPG